MWDQAGASRPVTRYSARRARAAVKRETIARVTNGGNEQKQSEGDKTQTGTGRGRFYNSFLMLHSDPMRLRCVDLWILPALIATKAPIPKFVKRR